VGDEGAHPELLGQRHRPGDVSEGGVPRGRRARGGHPAEQAPRPRFIRPLPVAARQTEGLGGPSLGFLRPALQVSLTEMG